MANEARGVELVIIISQPASESEMIVILKSPPKYRKLDLNKDKNAQKY